MIIKSCRRKQPSFDQLLRYIAAEGKSAGAPLLHNFPAAVDPGDLTAVIGAFQENARHLPVRRNGNALYQEILSFHPADAAALTPPLLADLARRYLQQRAPGAPAYAEVHTDTAHPHIHLVIAANVSGRSQKLRLSRSEFAAVKRELEAYQRARYPQLEHSLAQPPLERGSAVPTAPDNALPAPSGSAREDARARRLARQGREDPARKDLLRRTLLRALTGTDSEAAFCRRLAAAGLTAYSRRGRLTGVSADGRKYGFKTLGLTAALAAARTQWQRLPRQLRIIKADRLQRTQAYFRSFGYADELLETIAPAPATPGERRLQEDRCHRRQRRREARFRDIRRGRGPPERSR